MNTIQAQFPIIKHVNDDCGFVFPFGAWICLGDALASVAGIAADPTGELTIGPGTVINDTQAQASISGGVVGHNYNITVSIVTAQGCQLSRVFLLKVRDE